MSEGYKLMNDENTNDNGSSYGKKIVKVGVPVVGCIIGGLVSGPIAIPLSSGLLVAKIGGGALMIGSGTAGFFLGHVSRRITEKFIKNSRSKDQGQQWFELYNNYIQTDDCPVFKMPVCYEKDIRRYIYHVLKSYQRNSLGDLNIKFFELYKNRREKDNDTNIIIIKDAICYTKYLYKTFSHVFMYMNGKESVVCLNTIEDYVFSNIYNNISYAYQQKLCNEDEQFYKKCINLRNHLPKEFNDIGKKLNKRIYFQTLKNFEKAHTPISKLTYIEILLKQIPEENKDLTTDDLLTALIYVLVEYSPTRLYSNLGFIDDFRHQINGIYEYIYVTLFCAVKAIEELKRF